MRDESVKDEYMKDEYVKGDSCYASVIGCSLRGAHLELDNGQRAFAYNAAHLQNGSRIICTIIRSATERRSATAMADSVCFLYDPYGEDVCRARHAQHAQAA